MSASYQVKRLPSGFNMPADFRVKIEGSQPSLSETSSSIMMAEDIQKGSEGDDDKDVPLSSVYPLHKLWRGTMG